MLGVLTWSAHILLLLGSSSPLLWVGSSLWGCRQPCTHLPLLTRLWWASCWQVLGLGAGLKLGIWPRKLTVGWMQ